MLCFEDPQLDIFPEKIIQMGKVRGLQIDEKWCCVRSGSQPCHSWPRYASSWNLIIIKLNNISFN